MDEGKQEYSPARKILRREPGNSGKKKRNRWQEDGLHYVRLIASSLWMRNSVRSRPAGCSRGGFSGPGGIGVGGWPGIRMKSIRNDEMAFRHGLSVTDHCQSGSVLPSASRWRWVSCYATAPPQELPAPAVQPKQWSANTIRRPSTASKFQSKMERGTSPARGRSSIWLKSQSERRPS